MNIKDRKTIEALQMQLRESRKLCDETFKWSVLGWLLFGSSLLLIWMCTP